MRPASRASRDTIIHRTNAPYPDSPPRTSRSLSIHSAERRPLGPRSPSPLPPKSPQPFQTHVELPSMDDVLTMDQLRHPPLPTHQASNIPRSTRQSFFPSGTVEATPKGIPSAPVVPSTPIEPLIIKKKASIRTSTIPAGSPTPARRTHVRNSPLNRTANRVVSPRRVSPQVKKPRAQPAGSMTSEDFEHMRQLNLSMKEDVSFS